MDVFAEIAAERRALADFLEVLDEADWDVPSLCGAWTVRQVVAHLAMPLMTSLPRVALAIVKAGMNFDKANDRLSRDHAVGRSTEQLIADIRDRADRRFKPPGFGPEAPLSDVIIHGQDIRRPLGRPRVIPEARQLRVLEFLTGKRTTGFVPRKRLTGLRWEATDLDWASGEGVTVRGPAEAVMMALTGRAVAVDDLEGDGVAKLRTLL